MHTFDRVEYGHLLRLARRRQGLRQTDVAWHVGIAVSTLRELEHGRQTPSIETFNRLVIALDVAVSEVWPSGQLRRVLQR